MNRLLSLTFLMLTFSGDVFPQNYLKQSILTQGNLPKLPSEASLSVQKMSDGIAYNGSYTFTLPLFPKQLSGHLPDISIYYNTKGIKVEDESGETGLGWSHSFSGTISRTVNGYDDFAYRGDLTSNKSIYFNNDIQFIDTVPYPFYQMSYNLNYASTGTQIREINVTGTDNQGSALYVPLARLSNTQIFNGNTTFTTNSTGGNDEGDHSVSKEFEPDVYNVQVPGFSSEFVIDKRGQVLEKNITGAKYSFSYVKQGGGSYKINWTITAPNGYVYEFEKTDRKTPTDRTSSLSVDIASLWFLTKIITPSKDVVTYHYSSKLLNNIANFTGRTETQIEGIPSSKALSPISGETWELDAISGRGLQITFRREPRIDVAFGSRIAAIYLHRIEQNVPVIDSVSFYYNYFVGTAAASGSTGVLPSSGYNTQWLTHRLRLDSVTLNHAQGSCETYGFRYNTGGLPAKNSLSRDLWGYFTNRMSTSLLPLTYVYLGMFSGPVQTFGIADRSPAARENVEAFALKKIIYPTRGETEFEYENNDYNVAKSRKFDFSGLNLFDPVSSNDLKFESTYPLVAFGNTQQSLSFFIPPTDQIVPNTPISCKLEVVASVNDSYYNQTPNFQVTYVKVYDQNGNVVYDGDRSLREIVRYYVDSNGKQYIIFSNMNLNPGKYRIDYSFDKNWQYISIFLQLKVSWPRTRSTIINYLKKQNGPGLRIKKILNWSSPGALVTSTYYKYSELTPGLSIKTGNDTTLPASFGTLINRPFHLTMKVARTCAGDFTSGGSLFSSMSMANPPEELGYSRIIEMQIGTHNDTINKIYDYYSEPNTIGNYDGMFVAGLRYTDFPVNGLLIKERSYRSNPEQLIYSKTYNYHYELKNEVWAFKYFRSNDNVIPDGCLGPDKVISGFTYPVLNSGYVKKTAEIDSVFDGASWLVTRTDYTYKDYNKSLVSKSSFINSKGKELVTYFSYPQDFPGTTAVDSMIRRNMINVVMNKAAFSGSNEVSRERVSYDFWSSLDIVAPYKNENSFGGNALESETIFEKYDQHGNILQFTTRNGVTTSLLWGYDGLYPVAKVVGATYDAAQQYISVSILNSPASSQVLRDEIDKVRRNLLSAMVTTYTYNPLVGITSETSHNGRTSYFEYDKAGRLSLVRDNENKVIKVINYKYADQGN